MDAKTVSVTYSRRFNLGGYNNFVTLEGSSWADVDLEGGEKSEQVRQQLFADVKKAIKAELAPLLASRKDKERLTVDFLLQEADIAKQRIDELAAERDALKAEIARLTVALGGEPPEDVNQ